MNTNSIACAGFWQTQAQQDEARKLKLLAAWVRTHDCALDARVENGAVFATLHSWDRAEVHHTEWQRVGATLRECRDWLQY